MTFTKTRWTIESDRIVIRPFRMFFLMGWILAIIYVVIFLGYRGFSSQSPMGSTPFALFLLAILVFFFLGGFTYICFDRNTGKMQKMLFGFIPVRTISFDKLYKVNIVTHNAGGFNYKIFTKANKYGRGTVISSGYSKATDRNAVAFSTEVIPLIHQYLDFADPLPAEQPVTIHEYHYFTEAGGVYQLKANPTGTLILGLACLFVGIHEMTPLAWLQNTSTFGKLIVVIFPTLLGIIFISAAFTKITLDTNTRIIERKSPIGINAHRYNFSEFVNFQTIRKTYNGVYTGTDVIMYFQKEGSNKQKALLISSLRNTQKIERLIQEIESIMK
ncbi:hypothetical protein [Filimonas effusa]|uniref:Uncharacterized protein n=1 Tax=Filimonas effusa TaxID=2508721 RepID=A0A4Q1D423_9BACT|nr:hypothetical protein [Filimonas effusa]RXK83139.1 hypothetical protein ESB13_13540 [Filimonas effusa]